MPAVNLNRIYMLRARERRPILNGVNVPDAAGAYQRATMPALRARLAISENEARLKQDDIHRKYQGIATGIRAFGNALDTTSRYMEQREREMERAQARQSASTRMEVENRYRQYMLDHAQEIYATPYGRETDGAGNLKITGPFSKALEVHNGFWDNDPKAAELRETLGEDDRARLEQEYTNWGFALQSDSAKKQSELNQQYMLKNWKDRVNTLKGEISNSLERGDVDAWKRSMMEYVEFAGEGAEIELGIRDLGGGLKRPPTEEQAATISDVKRVTAEKLAMERIEFLHRSYIMDGDADTLAEIQAWGAEQALSDAGRLHARELAEDAQEKWEQKQVQDDSRAIAGQAEALAALANEGADVTEEQHGLALAELRRVQAGLNTPAARAAFGEKIDNAQMASNKQLGARIFSVLDQPEHRDALLGTLEGRKQEDATPTMRGAREELIKELSIAGDTTEFMGLYEEKMGTADEPKQFGSAEEWLAAKSELEKKAKSLKTKEGREAAFGKIIKLGEARTKAEEEAKKAGISNLLTFAENGCIPVTYEDGSTGVQNADFDQLLRAYKTLAPDMTMEQRAKVRASLKDLAAKRAELPKDSEILQAFEWLGVKPSERTRIFGNWTDDSALFFERSGTSLFTFGESGWELDSKSFGRMDDNRDGYIQVKRAGKLGGGTIELSEAGLQAVLEALRAYKRAQVLADNPPALETVLGQRLQGIRDRATAQQLVEKANEAARTYEQTFDSIMYFQNLGE